MKKNLKGGLVVILCVALAGCGPTWQKKFVRKRAENKPDQVFVYEPKEYQKEPNFEIYKRSFLFWKAWQEELVSKLGENRTGDLRCFEEVFKNLGEMKSCLNEQKANELEGYIKKAEAFYAAYKSGDSNIIQSRHMREDLDRLMLKIDKLFRYSGVKEFIK